MSSLDFTQENTGGSQLSQDMPGGFGNGDLSLNFGNDGAVELSQNSFDYFAGGMSTGLNSGLNSGSKGKKSGSSGNNRRNQSDNSQNDFTGQSQGPGGNSMLSQDSNYGGNFDYQFSQN